MLKKTRVAGKVVPLRGEQDEFSRQVADTNKRGVDSVVDSYSRILTFFDSSTFI